MTDLMILWLGMSLCVAIAIASTTVNRRLDRIAAAVELAAAITPAKRKGVDNTEDRQS